MFFDLLFARFVEKAVANSNSLTQNGLTFNRKRLAEALAALRRPAAEWTCRLAPRRV
jgi:hypothetical protein